MLTVLGVNKPNVKIKKKYKSKKPMSGSLVVYGMEFCAAKNIKQILITSFHI